MLTKMMKVVMAMTAHRKRMKMMVTKIVWVMKLMLNIYIIYALVIVSAIACCCRRDLQWLR